MKRRRQKWQISRSRQRGILLPICVIWAVFGQELGYEMGSRAVSARDDPNHDSFTYRATLFASRVSGALSCEIQIEGSRRRLAKGPIKEL